VEDQDQGHNCSTGRQRKRIEDHKRDQTHPCAPYPCRSASCYSLQWCNMPSCDWEWDGGDDLKGSGWPSCTHWRRWSPSSHCTCRRSSLKCPVVDTLGPLVHKQWRCAKKIHRLITIRCQNMMVMRDHKSHLWKVMWMAYQRHVVWVAYELFDVDL